MVLVFLVARFPWRGFSVVDAEFLERLTKSKIKNQKSKIKNQKSKKTDRRSMGYRIGRKGMKSLLHLSTLIWRC